jgi:ribonuclease PH
MERLGERQIQVDCDVLQADGGTRTTAISGAWIALHDALDRLVRDGELSETPLLDHLAAISVGVVAEVPVLDLPYVEDSTAEVDMNIVANGSGRLVEVQGTAEGAAFERATLDRLIDLGLGGISQIVELQAEAIGSRLTPRG